jgi:acetoin utilization deacetylase AcuC-like enzyme
LATLLVQDPIFLDHLVPSGHVERPERLKAIDAALSDDRFSDLVRRKSLAIGTDKIAAAHHPAYVDAIRASIPESGIAQIESDTFLSPESFTVAVHAAGAACLAVDLVMSGDVANAFSASRPPGHHAETAQAMGFCLFNNAVIAARRAQSEHGIARVAIIDWDVHHGNGTQAIVWEDATILYASTHQMPLYPGTGAPSETGVGNIFNVPLSPGRGGAEFRQAFTDGVLPPIDAFEPQFVIVSAGFDAHWRDPLAEINLEKEDFAWATRAVMDLAARHADGRIVSLLEGGYDLIGLSESVAAHVATLMTA